MVDFNHPPQDDCPDMLKDIVIDVLIGVCKGFSLDPKDIHLVLGNAAACHAEDLDDDTSKYLDELIEALIEFRKEAYD